MANALSFSGVNLAQNENLVLSNIDWSVDSADRWVVLGPNGAGKTSLLRLAALQLHASSGEVSVLGSDTREASVTELRSRIGFSSSALAVRIPPEATVRDVVMTAAYGVNSRAQEEYSNEDEERAEAVLWAFGMREFLDRRFETLSEGESKRVQIARALMADPELLLLDEPSAGLDLGGREELLLALTELAGDRRSPCLVMVTHHVEEIPPGFTHALILNAGKVIAQGPLAQTVTSQNLSRAYGMDIVVESSEGRLTARGAR